MSGGGRVWRGGLGRGGEGRRGGAPQQPTCMAKATNMYRRRGGWRYVGRSGGGERGQSLSLCSVNEFLVRSLNKEFIFICGELLYDVWCTMY